MWQIKKEVQKKMLAKVLEFSDVNPIECFAAYYEVDIIDLKSLLFNKEPDPRLSTLKALADDFQESVSEVLEESIAALYHIGYYDNKIQRRKNIK